MSVGASDLNLDLQGEAPYGVVVDWDMGNAIVTTVAFETGDASIYLSSGQGFIGGSKHEAIVKAARNLVNSAAPYVGLAERAEGEALPSGGHVRFHLLTRNGHYAHEERMTDIEQGSSPWRPLFDLSQTVIGEYRQISN